MNKIKRCFNKSPWLVSLFNGENWSGVYYATIKPGITVLLILIGMVFSVMFIGWGLVLASMVLGTYKFIISFVLCVSLITICFKIDWTHFDSYSDELEK